jgi:ABC-type molybdate transport system permease subunit
MTTIAIAVFDQQAVLIKMAKRAVEVLKQKIGMAAGRSGRRRLEILRQLALPVCGSAFYGPVEAVGKSLRSMCNKTIGRE